MSRALVRPRTESLIIPGPAGDLEAILDTPEGSAATHVGVVCHPHPMHGGTMTNKVAHMLAKSFNEAGAPAVRFNFRGVGNSAGAFDEGRGETDDSIAVLDWAARRWPQARLWLGGFSFGGAIGVRAASQRDLERLITVAPAIQRVSVETDKLPRCPWLVVQGDRDELVNAEEVSRWIASLARPPELRVLSGVDHFFHGRLNELRDVVVDWLKGP
jgi:alpha/beta superfamily hydrolase